MRDKLISILRDVRHLKGDMQHFTRDELLEEIETNAMAALHCDKIMIPSKLFGELKIPQDIITIMSNGDDELWFSVSQYFDVNVTFLDEPQSWQFIIYPVKNGHIDTSTELEIGKL